MLDIHRMVEQLAGLKSPANRCTAAQAACLREVRDGGVFLLLTDNWGEFCRKFIGISRSAADRHIKRWEESGARRPAA